MLLAAYVSYRRFLSEMNIERVLKDTNILSEFFEHQNFCNLFLKPPNFTFYLPNLESLYNFERIEF